MSRITLGAHGQGVVLPPDVMLESFRAAKFADSFYPLVGAASLELKAG